MIGKPIVLFLDVPVPGPIYDLMAELRNRTVIIAPPQSSPEAVEAAKGKAVACIARTARLTRAELESMPRLKVLSAWGVGYDHIDVPAATALGIPVCINPVFSRSMAEAALTLVLALAKRLPQQMRDARAGRRPLESERGMEIRGKILGIVGLGRIGLEVGELGHRLEMHVMAHDPHLRVDGWPVWCASATLDHLLRSADFVVVAAPLTAQTHHLIGAEQLESMKPSASLINIARGALVDEAALLSALQRGRIAGAGLDVWELEPVRPDHPLLALENVIGTPHRLGATHESLARLCDAIQANILRVLEGQDPRDVVNPEVLKGGHNDH